MGVAAGALRRDAQDAFADSIHAIEDTFDSELLGLCSAFLVGHGVSEVSGSDVIVLRCVRNKITGDLFNDKVVISHVLVQGLNDPVTVEMHLAREVFLVACGVCIACDVQPFPRPFFAIMRRGKETRNPGFKL